jgi:predicted nucleotidyltransferase
MILHGVTFPEDRVAEFCRRHRIVRMSLFGSIIRDAAPPELGGFNAESDVDVLVEFEPGQVPSLLRFAGMQVELAAMIKREVQLATPPMLSPYFRANVIREARVLHAA